jgi:hypothetical protein
MGALGIAVTIDWLVVVLDHRTETGGGKKVAGSAA